MCFFKSKKNVHESEPQQPFVSAVIVAAGNSTRMGGVNKQFLFVDGVPVLIRTLSVFERCPLIREIVVAARETDIPDMYAMIREYGLTKVKEIVKGGDTRQESVTAAIERTAEECDFLAIHDGARPLVTERVLEDTLEAAFCFHAAATGTRVKDTIKVAEDGIIRATPDRARLWAVQTPQIFRKETYLSALQTVPNSRDFTDDCKLMEEYGQEVRMVEGDYENIKITTPVDIILAEAIIKAREEACSE